MPDQRGNDMLSPILTDSPIQELTLDEAGDNRIWIKRDDLLPFSFGGNKVRIGHAFLQDCVQKGCDAIILYGDRRSNLCRVMASMCIASGIEALMIATSENEEEQKASFNEKMIRSLGIRILECEKNEIAQTVDRAMEILGEEGRKPYYIYGNRFGEGNEAVAASAYVNASGQILSWEKESGHCLDFIFTACGTGSTLAGLAVGMLEGGSSAHVQGISISSRSTERAQGCLLRSARAWYEKEGRTPPADLEQHLFVDTGYNCGGYGVKDERVLNLIKKVFRDTSIPLDPTYTGKAMRGMLDYLKEHQISGRNILFLHTGGTPLFFDTLTDSLDI